MRSILIEPHDFFSVSLVGISASLVMCVLFQAFVAPFFHFRDTPRVYRLRAWIHAPLLAVTIRMLHKPKSTTHRRPGKLPLWTSGLFSACYLKNLLSCAAITIHNMSDPPKRVFDIGALEAHPHVLFACIYLLSHECFNHDEDIS
ncbi:hypothetical protein EJ04DRAFT_137642 [Polyplosphaeria fusca]|uniref:Uncharacterized protein n=1 Tax=Polyplosphaeria fusca TaxID=682080 RepID=A0A9P4QHL3_9PLEO|nr:hypothetical protein EJ04DRAFT_137642 [Polyplosphaeria fusca]